jgi:hypothetical protein
MNFAYKFCVQQNAVNHAEDVLNVCTSRLVLFRVTGIPSTRHGSTTIRDGRSCFECSSGHLAGSIYPTSKSNDITSRIHRNDQVPAHCAQAHTRGSLSHHLGSACRANLSFEPLQLSVHVLFIIHRGSQRHGQLAGRCRNSENEPEHFQKKCKHVFSFEPKTGFFLSLKSRCVMRQVASRLQRLEIHYDV